MTEADRAAERRREQRAAELPPGMGKINASKDVCDKGGHPLSGANLILVTDKDGGVHRLCRECHRDQVRRASSLRRELARAASA